MAIRRAGFILHIFLILIILWITFESEFWLGAVLCFHF